MADEASDYNTKIINEFRANQGRVGGPWADIPLLLIHHIGVRSGIERVTPVAYHPQPGGRLAIWAANGGSPVHPGWYHNLKARPRVTVEVGGQAFTVVAQELDGTAHGTLWSELVSVYPQLGEAQAKTARRIPLFTLTRQDLPAARTGPLYPADAATALSARLNRRQP